VLHWAAHRGDREDRKMNVRRLGGLAAASMLLALVGCNGSGEQNTVDTGVQSTNDGSSMSGMDATVDPADGLNVDPADVATSGGGSDASMSANDDANTLPIDSGACPDGQGMCPYTAFNNEPTSNFQCRALINGHCPAPDLVVVRDLMVDDGDGHTMDLVVQNIAADDPVIAEGCIHAPGARRLLRFNYGSMNQGNDHLRVGRPNEADPLHWQWSQAHQHFHVMGWAYYGFYNMAGRQMGYGHKQSFCLEDNIRDSDMAGPREFAPPLCENFDPHTPYDQRPEFGLSPDWGDEYPAGLACQYVDLGPDDATSPDYIPDGFYSLAVTINQTDDGQHLYRESDYTNNTAAIRVQIHGNAVQACDDHAGDACAGGTTQCNGACAP
jgi:hypothetical protein